MEYENLTIFHFQEGNLPNNSKCVKCKKTCWSPDSLTGMRCQWCGMSAHSSCLPNLPNSHGVCQFGLLEPIFLSPQAISIPRSQMTQDRSIAKSHALMQARKCLLLFTFGAIHILRNAIGIQCSGCHWKVYNAVL